MSRVKDKVAVVTGGGQGIGRAACLLLAREGSRVAVTDIGDKEAQEAADEIISFGGRAKFWRLDVSDEKEVEKVFEQIFGEFGKINILVNNAGISGADKPTHRISNEEWDQVMNINVKGVFYCTKYVIPYMKDSGGGSIINISSIHGITSTPGVPPYHASKGAVRLISKTDALIYAKDKIRVNSIHPGYIWTPLVEELGRRSEMGTEAFRGYLDKLHPVGHVGEPDDIAYGIIYLASDESKFVTGSELVIDGGYTAR